MKAFYGAKFSHLFSFIAEMANQTATVTEPPARCVSRAEMIDWNGSQSHRCKAYTLLIVKVLSRAQLFYRLPIYSPELNASPFSHRRMRPGRVRRQKQKAKSIDFRIKRIYYPMRMENVISWLSDKNRISNCWWSKIMMILLIKHSLKENENNRWIELSWASANAHQNAVEQIKITENGVRDINANHFYFIVAFASINTRRCSEKDGERERKKRKMDKWHQM